MPCAEKADINIRNHNGKRSFTKEIPLFLWDFNPFIVCKRL